ncbi:MAG: PQQ-like beta-propeller repeat protein [Bifidobacteriaceae bacterium]|jgi:outer membrane protein assembly factor BamB|nr:PQQ-like beta-propeller repeat protein [Bifidobacteriaceae bacterium]
MRLREPLIRTLICLTLGSFVLAGCTNSKGSGESPDQDTADGGAPAAGEASLGPAVTGEPTGSMPWALTPVLAESGTLFAVNNLMDVASQGMWELGAGVSAFDLATGEQRWHIDYDADVFGIDPAALPTEATAEVFSNKEGKIAIVFSSMTCPGDECTGEETEDFALVVADAQSGEVLSSTVGTGAFPTVVAFVGDVVAYAPDWEQITAVKADAASGEPVWQSATFDIYPDSVIDGAVFTAIPEDVPDSLGWVMVADGSPAGYSLDLDAYQSFHLDGPEQAFVTWGDGEDHVVEMVDPKTSELIWQAVVPASEEENETLQVTATRVVLSYDSEDGYRTVALNRETGEQVWTRDDASAGQVTDNWALLDNSGTATTWEIVNVEDGAKVSSIDASTDILPSVELLPDIALVAHSGVLEARPLTGENAGSDAPVWSIETASPDSEVTSQLGELVVIDPQSGSTQLVELDQG